MDAAGKASNEGTIEEFWASPHKVKITYTANNFIQTNYWIGDGVLQSGSADLPSYLITNLWDALIEPLPGPEFLETKTFDSKERDLGAVKLICVSAKIAPPPGIDHFQKSVGPTYCLNTDKPVLRIKVEGFGSGQALGNQIAIFQGRYLPKQVRVVNQDKTVASLQVETLEAITPLDESVFTPSAEARSLSPALAIPSAIASGMLVTQALPHYPIAAKQSHTQGTVVLRALIGKDGKISNLGVESGPLQLQQAATDAVKQWVYWPYFVDGQPVEVATKINVVFNLAN